ncbi:RecX family transcriptional regulator [Siccirubricoccus sp. G192]|uniref:RecX family transcriptional regulator n=1 Tax=Siccirubricoccus sp. G192 TaxID=2849651 RepID=UPI001C2C6C34|nr:RecX family transcriptional regulator [Siccirubricoccus sp. G192]MBV1796285.1 RecX family transcriptional regulator [Siccirubricoccus sp. G192]
MARDGDQDQGRRGRRGRAGSQPRPPPAAGPAPTAALLHEAALNHLARFAATEAGLRRVLQRRVDRWARRAEAEGTAPAAIAPQAAAAKAAAALVAQRLVASGVVDDAAFAAARARRLARAGRSRRAIAAHLAGKGVAREAADAALPEAPEAELDAALAYCRRRRIGPFAAEPPTPEARLKSMAALARAGFGRDTAEAALEMDPAVAEERLIALRRG